MKDYKAELIASLRREIGYLQNEHVKVIDYKDTRKCALALLRKGHIHTGVSKKDIRITTIDERKHKDCIDQGGEGMYWSS